MWSLAIEECLGMDSTRFGTRKKMSFDWNRKGNSDNDLSCIAHTVCVLCCVCSTSQYMICQKIETHTHARTVTPTAHQHQSICMLCGQRRSLQNYRRKCVRYNRMHVCGVCARYAEARVWVRVYQYVLAVEKVTKIIFCFGCVFQYKFSHCLVGFFALRLFLSSPLNSFLIWKNNVPINCISFLPFFVKWMSRTASGNFLKKRKCVDLVSVVFVVHTHLVGGEQVTNRKKNYMWIASLCTIEKHDQTRTNFLNFYVEFHFYCDGNCGRAQLILSVFSLHFGSRFYCETSSE